MTLWAPQAGKFGKTRDGRKVGPMEANGNASLHVWRDKLGSCNSWRHDGRHNAQPRLDLIAEWTEPMTTPPNIITSAIDGETYDLFTNRIRWDLLPKDVQESFEAWPHGLLVWFTGLRRWGDLEMKVGVYITDVYRAKPAPKVTEHVLWWDPLRYASIAQWDFHTHKITMTHTGDTLPFEVFTAPSGATITVEKAND